jgi:glyoxylase-like metal-dependent hydrolase (beta-lactamase superfamily II)
MDFEKVVSAEQYGTAQRASPLIRRIVARNPSPFTYSGTGTYVVGNGRVAVIDPGPDDAGHVASMLRALAGETVSAILVTHSHMDHSPAARALKRATGAPIIGCAPLGLDDGGERQDAAFDLEHAPDVVMQDGDAVSGPGWTLTAVATPGHTANHICFALEQEATLFTGDHVMGWSTTVVAPPDGDMADYMASLDKLLGRDDRVYYPTHGPAVEEPQRLVRGLIGHRRQREAQIRRLLAEGPLVIPDMVAAMYALVDRRLWAAAGRSVLAHLIDLERRGEVASDAGGWRLR